MIAFLRDEQGADVVEKALINTVSSVSRIQSTCAKSFVSVTERAESPMLLPPSKILGAWVYTSEETSMKHSGRRPES